MKKNHGFTLIELLAVIVLLAIIALIAVPIILNVIEKSRFGSIRASALGYIDAIEKQVAINIINKDATQIPDGKHDIQMLEVKIKGNSPLDGWVQIEKSRVVDYSLKFDGYVAYLDDGKMIVEKFNIKKFIITFDAAQGSVEQSTKKVIEKKEIGALPIPIRENYEFDGWYLDDTLYTNKTVYEINKDIILTAHWKKYPSVTLTTEADTVLGQIVKATLITDVNGNIPSESYSVTKAMSNNTVIFLKKPGTYRITSSSSDGLANYSDDIAVTYENNYTINKYVVKKYLFNNGDITENSGGWGIMWEASGGTPGASTSGGSVGTALYLTGGSSYKKDLYAKNTIDLTGWKKIVVVCTYHNNIGSGWSAIHLYTPGGYYSSSQTMTVTNGVGFAQGTTTLDVSGTDTQRQVRLALLAARTEWNVSQVYLEK